MKRGKPVKIRRGRATVTGRFASMTELCWACLSAVVGQTITVALVRWEDGAHQKTARKPGNLSGWAEPHLASRGVFCSSRSGDKKVGVLGIWSPAILAGGVRIARCWGGARGYRDHCAALDGPQRGHTGRLTEGA